ncbi:MAG: hypothetical protein ACREHG_07350 [Candidatus Saccharimonadales bacterium]
MNAEDQPARGNILPPPVEPGDVLSSEEISHGQVPVAPEARGNNIAAPPPLIPQTNTVSASITTGAISDLVQQTDTVAQKPAAASNNRATQDDLAKRYDDEARKIIGRYAADPYLEVEKIEVVKQNYLRDVYNHRVKLPQT